MMTSTRFAFFLAIAAGCGTEDVEPPLDAARADSSMALDGALDEPDTGASPVDSGRDTSIADGSSDAQDARLDADTSDSSDAAAPADADPPHDAGPEGACRIVDQVDLTSDTSIMEGSVTFDSENDPVVAFREHAGAFARLAVARRKRGVWTTRLLSGDVLPLATGSRIRVAADDSGGAHIAFNGIETVGSESTLAVYYVADVGEMLAAAELVREGLVARTLDVVVDADGAPELFFDDVPTDSGADVVSARREGESWTVTTTQCAVPAGGDVRLSAASTATGRTLAVVASAFPVDSAADTVSAAEALASTSTWSCAVVGSASRSSGSASLAVDLAASSDGSNATMVYRDGTSLAFAARTTEGWSASPEASLRQVPRLVALRSGGFVTLRSHGIDVVVDRYAFGAAAAHAPEATERLPSSAYPLFWGEDTDDGLRLAFVRPAGSDSELVEAECAPF